MLPQNSTTGQPLTQEATTTWQPTSRSGESQTTNNNGEGGVNEVENTVKATSNGTSVITIMEQIITTNIVPNLNASIEAELNVVIPDQQSLQIGLWILLGIFGCCCCFVVILLFIRKRKYEQDISSEYAYNQPPVQYQETTDASSSSSSDTNSDTEYDSDDDDNQQIEEHAFV